MSIHRRNCLRNVHCRCRTAAVPVFWRVPHGPVQPGRADQTPGVFPAPARRVELLLCPRRAAVLAIAPASISTQAVLVSGLLRAASCASRRFSRCGSTSTGRLCMPQDSPDTKPLSLRWRRILWGPATPGYQSMKMMAQCATLAQACADAQSRFLRRLPHGPRSHRHLSGSNRIAMNNIKLFSVGGRNPKSFAGRDYI